MGANDQPGERRTGDADALWGYLGVGCLTFFGGLAGGAMTSVLIAKIVGAMRGCVPDAESGAPCGWFVYAVIGGAVGAVVLPAAAITRLRRGRIRNAKMTERG